MKFMDQFYRQEASSCARIALYQGKNGATVDQVAAWGALAARQALRCMALNQPKDQAAEEARASIAAFAVGS